MELMGLDQIQIAEDGFVDASGWGAFFQSALSMQGAGSAVMGSMRMFLHKEDHPRNNQGAGEESAGATSASSVSGAATGTPTQQISHIPTSHQYAYKHPFL
jgi:hypothetical protein